MINEFINGLFWIMVIGMVEYGFLKFVIWIGETYEVECGEWNENLLTYNYTVVNVKKKRVEAK